MANPQTENGHMRIANEIWDEVIRRDFSKRQKDILQFIWRLSYGCQKKEAYIPKLKHFELCGVGQTNITKELAYLVQCKVIFWNKEDRTFIFNKDYERWQVSPVKGWNEEDFKHLLRLNLEKKLSKQEVKTYQNDNFPETKTYQNNKFRLIKTISFFGKKLSKQEVSARFKPRGSKAEGVSKASSKAIIKSITTVRTDADTESSETEYPAQIKQVVDAFARIHKKFAEDVGSMELLYMNQLLNTGIPANFIILAMESKFDEKQRKGGKINGFSYYVEFIKEAWQRSQSITESPVPSGPVALGITPKSKQQTKNELAAQKIREAEERERGRGAQNLYAD